MSIAGRLSSDDSSDGFPFKFQSKGIGHTKSILKTEWDAIESYLYQEDDHYIRTLKPHILNECRIWRDSFTYLRVRGRKLHDPQTEEKQNLKLQLVDAVVERVIDKIAKEFSIAADKEVSDKICENKHLRPNAASRESYFERGKPKNDYNNLTLPQDSSKSQVTTISSQDSKGISTKLLPLPNPPARGILKNSPSRLAQHKRQRTRTKNEHSKVMGLPRISTRNNRLEQTKLRCENSKNYCKLQGTRVNRGPIVSSDYFFLPPISPKM